MTIYGVHPGLTMLGRDLDITVSIIVTLALGNLFVTLLGMVATGQLAKLTLIPFPLLAAVLLPVTFVAAFLNTFHWGDIITVCAMFSLGISMKWLGWPRPPLLLGFILGPIIEQNLWPSVQLWGWGFVSRPLTVALVVAAVLSVTYLTRALSKAELADSPEAAPSMDRGNDITFGVTRRGLPSTGALNTGGGPILSRLRWPVLRFIWRWDAAFSMVILVAVAWFFLEAQTFRHSEGRFLPTWLGFALVPLLVLQIGGRLFASGQQGAIMDLGMADRDELGISQEAGGGFGVAGGVHFLNRRDWNALCRGRVRDYIRPHPGETTGSTASLGIVARRHNGGAYLPRVPKPDGH